MRRLATDDAAESTVCDEQISFSVCSLKDISAAAA